MEVPLYKELAVAMDISRSSFAKDGKEITQHSHSTAY